MSNAASEPLKIAVVGLGEVGRSVAAAVLADPTLKLAGLVDIDPTKAGKRLADLGVANDEPTAIFHDVEQLTGIDVAILCGGSHLDRVAPTLRQLMRLGVPVVSSCEEMTWPWLKHPHLADVLAGEARKAGVPILGAGVFPGFGFDRRPLAIAALSTGLRRIAVRRVVDLNSCPPSLLRRTGLTKTITQFTKLAKQKLVGQIGLAESVVLIAQGLGRHPMAGQIGMTVLPLPAVEAIDSPLGRIDVGHVSGVRQRAVFQDDGLEIELELTLSLHPEATGDKIQTDADATFEHVLSGTGPSPDDGPSIVLISVARQIRALPPGLRTVLDLSPTSPQPQEPA